MARARREGDYPLSHDAVALGSFAAALLAFAASVPLGGALTAGAIERAMAGHADARLFLGPGLVTAAACLGGAAGALGATLAQTRGLTLRAPPLRLVWTSPLGRLPAFAALRGIVALALAGAALCALTRARLEGLLGGGRLESMARGAWETIGEALGIVLAIGTVLAAADLLVVHSAWRRKLRMTHDEIRRDLRENDGDPQTRTRRRRAHRLVVRGSLRQIPRATFVVVNPTHVAVALRYVPTEMPVPTILVRAADDLALRVRALALEAAVPLVEDVMLARRLYAHGALGSIPPELYIAVAHVVASLQRGKPR